MSIKATALIKKFEQALKEKSGYIWGQAGTTWTQAKQEALVTKMVKTYGPDWINSEKAKKNNYYQGARYGSKWIGHTVYDCSGLFRWAFEQLGGKIAHGSNSIWDSYCTAKGKLTAGKRADGKELQPGTAVFTATADGQHNHVGLYIGDGFVIEAKGTQAGVIKDKVVLSKWAAWGELKGVKYPVIIDNDPIIGEDQKQHPTLRKGDKGNVVMQMQARLIGLGYSCGSYGADGDFGSGTEKAVKAFQKDHGLTADGICGPKTWAALDAADFPEQTDVYTVMIPRLTQEEADALRKKYPSASVTKG